MPMPDADISVVAECETVDCVVDYVDTITEDQRLCYEPKWMDGYRMPSLRWLLDNGRLNIKTIPDWKKIQLILLFGKQGNAIISPGVYGDFHSATVEYMTGGNWQTVLAHELMHVAGPCADSWWLQRLFQKGFLDYTNKQREIMLEEVVDSWTDTSFYQNEDPAWHMPNKRKN